MSVFLEEFDGHRIYKGDSLHVMRSFELPEISLVFADPPYNVGKKYADHDDCVDDFEYLGWCKKWIEIAKRRSEQLFIYPPKKYLREYWNMLPENHLIICGFSPSGAIRGSYIHQYVPLLAPAKPKNKIPDHWWNVQMPALGFFYHEKRYDHPAQTSLEVTMRAIEAFTEVGDCVLDPFGGTGTTAEACIRLDRKCIYIEKSEEYIEIAIDRIKTTLMQPSLI